MLAPLPPSAWDSACAAHLLRRAGFGGPPSAVEALRALGPKQAVQFLLTGAPGESSRSLPMGLQTAEEFKKLRRMVRMVRQTRNDPEAQEKARRALREAERAAASELRAWWLQAMRASGHPLREKMTLFWHGHFTSGLRKVRSTEAMAGQNETFREHALGDFRVLSRLMPTDPAMMSYLDIYGSAVAQPNENFARELMELFLLGEGNYTEEDVREAARAFTGYYHRPALGESGFQKRRHDPGPLKLFGKTLPSDPVAVVDAVIEHPACAPYMAGKIWNFFAGRDPDPPLRKALAQTLRTADYRLDRFLETLFLSEVFYDAPWRGSQITSPVQWLVGTATLLEVPLQGDRPEQTALNQLGQELFEPPSVKGWEGGRAWIGASTFLTRCNLAQSLFLDPRRAGDRLPDPQKLAPAAQRTEASLLCQILIDRLLPVPPSPATRQTLLAAATSRGLPASDETVFKLTALLLATPEYQLA